MPTRSRFHPVNPSALRSLRRQLGWSQAELGKRAGYCERVIRKAEAGGSLSINTIDNLVLTFLTHNIPVTARELIYSEDVLAQRFIGSYDSHGVAMLDQCEQYLTDDFTLDVSAVKTVLQIAGKYVGKERFNAFLGSYFKHFTREANSLTPTYLTAKGRVAAQFEEKLQFLGEDIPPFWVNVHFYFHAGQIARADVQFDYVLVTNTIEDIRRRADY